MPVIGKEMELMSEDTSNQDFKVAMVYYSELPKKGPLEGYGTFWVDCCFEVCTFKA